MGVSGEVYDFDKLVDRFDRGSIKWEHAKEYFVKRNLAGVKFGSGDGLGLMAVSTADMDFCMAPAIVRAVQRAASELVYGYTLPTGEYYDALISWMFRRHGWRVERDCVVLSPGVVAAIHYAISAFTNTGDGVIVQMPVYRPFHASVKSLGRNVVNNPLIREELSYRIDFADLECKASDPQVKMLILCNPHNPIGQVWSRDDLEQLASICTTHSVMVVADEIHADVIFPPFKHTPFGTLPSRFIDNSIICTSPSKSFNMCGLQISNIVIQNESIRKRFEQTAGNFGFHAPNCFAAAAVVAAYNESEDWFEQLLKYLYANHVLVRDFLGERLSRVGVFPLQGTYLQWLDFANVNLDYAERARVLRERLGIFFESGYIFGAGGESFERLNLAYPRFFLQELLDRLDKFFNA
ncbi:MAG: pyridoxal phosphate-dependent aminotransferase [Planctomycetaceae bacterium]|nr:pyridoxal phosphate-dependent aminotransferase [Planctomycetaceae bacterium]